MLMLLSMVCCWSVLIIGARRTVLVNNPWNIGLITSVLAIIMVISVGYADNSASTVADRPIYVQEFRNQDRASTPWVSGLFRQDRLFSLFLWGLARVAPATEVVLYVTVTTVVLLCYLAAARLLLPEWATLAALITLQAMGLVTSYAGVAIRQGLAMSCLVVAVALYARGSGGKRSVLALLLGAGLLHWSAIAPAIGLLLLSWRTPSFRSLILIWSTLAGAFLAGLPERVYAGLETSLPSVDGYSSIAAFGDYPGGANRLDFLALSAAFIVIAIVGRRYIGPDDKLQRLVAAYVLLNAMFLLLGFIAFSDRLAAYSWFLGPLLVWYPLSRKSTDSSVAWSMLGLVAVIAVGALAGNLTQLGV